MSTPSKGMREIWDERGKQIAELRAQGMRWSDVADRMNVGVQGAKQSLAMWRKRQQAAAEGAE